MKQQGVIGKEDDMFSIDCIISMNKRMGEKLKEKLQKTREISRISGPGQTIWELIEINKASKVESHLVIGNGKFCS